MQDTPLEYLWYNNAPPRTWRSQRKFMPMNLAGTNWPDGTRYYQISCQDGSRPVAASVYAVSLPDAISAICKALPRACDFEVVGIAFKSRP